MPKYPTRPGASRLSDLKRKQIYKGAIVDLGLETFQLDPDRPPATFEIVRHPGGAAVAALNGNSEVCLLKQYRHAVSQWLWELPAGKIDDQEPPAKTIRRELEEEAGILAESWTPLGQIVSSPGILDEVLHLYLARELSQTPTQHERHEYIEIHWIDFSKAVDMALDGEITDAKSIITLLRAQSVLRSHQP